MVRYNAPRGRILAGYPQYYLIFGSTPLISNICVYCFTQVSISSIPSCNEKHVETSNLRNKSEKKTAKLRDPVGI